jgi:hypothetical protein
MTELSGGLKMKKWLILSVAMWVTLGLFCPASAASTYNITFDDVPTPDGNWGVVQDGYMGFDWNFIEVERITDYQQTYNNNTITFPSSPLAALNGGNTGGNELVSFSSSKPFLLEGAYFSTWAQNNNFTSFSSRGITVTGYLDGNVVGSTKISLTSDFVWQDTNFGPMDLVEFRHQEQDNSHWWLMDNMKVSAVPLPATLVLFGGGLFALVVFGKRRTNG